MAQTNETTTGEQAAPRPDWETMRALHGHIGPWLVLGVRLGELAMQMLGARKHFGIRVEVDCPVKPPPSCILDGFQWSTGATYGKRNIEARPADGVSGAVTNTDTGDVFRFEVLGDTADRFAAWYREQGEDGASRETLAACLRSLATWELVKAGDEGTGG